MYARSDLALAQEDSSEVMREMRCFHAQQAAEKAIKAVLVARDIDFPYTHNIAKLLSIVRDSGVDLADGLDPAADLMAYAVHLRYPGPHDRISEDERAEAASIAEVVVRWAEKLIDCGES
jgi:HEPN domain-containing protein